MKVVHFITGLATGGAERALYNVLAGGLASSSNPVVVSLRDEGTYGHLIRAEGVPVYALGLRQGIPGPAALWQLRRLVRHISPDIVQGWMYHGNLAASVAARMTAGPRPAVAWNIRQCLYSLAEEKPLTRQVIHFSRWLSGEADSILYNSRLSRDQHEAFGFAAQRGRVIPNGFDTERLCSNDERGRAIREALGIPLKKTVIGHVARFHPMKDHASFLRAAVSVMRERADVVCLLVGRMVNFQNPALAGIVPLELKERFFFVGERNDVPDLMRAMDLFCQSSWSEAFPNVLGEAMALGVPCVATDVGDSRDIIGDTGMVVRPSDSSALAQGLLAMLARTTMERVALGRAARLRIETYYGLVGVVEQYNDTYKKITSI